MEKKVKKRPPLLMYLRRLFIDFILASSAFALATLFERGHFKAEIAELAVAGAVCVVISVILLAVFDSYRAVWKYAGAQEALNLILAASSSYVLQLILVTSVPNNLNLSLITLYALISFILFAAERYRRPFFIALMRRLNENTVRDRQKIIVYGAGYTGAAVIKRFVENVNEKYVPIAVLDDDKKKRGLLLYGVPVVGDGASANSVMRRYGASIVVIAISDITRERLREIYSELSSIGAIVKVVNDISSIDANKEIKIGDIDIEYLLGRREHTMDRELLGQLIKNRTVMVTGGAGSIGSEICRQTLEYGCRELIIYDRHENGMFLINEELKKSYGGVYKIVIGSVRDREKLRETVRKYRPDVIFHAAAYKHVPMMEIAVDEAVKNNVTGTKNAIEIAEEEGVGRFVLISTDKAVNPSSVMGATKRIAELILQEHAARKDVKTAFSAVRFGNVLGSSGSVIPTFLRQINNREPVTVTHREMKRYFMSIPEAVSLVMEAGALSKGGEVFVLDMGEPVYIYDLAYDLIKLSGLVPDKDVPIKITGLRPGEKLFEELRFNHEEADKTTHDGIFICRLSGVDNDWFLNKLKLLEEAGVNGDAALAEKIIFEIVPSGYRKN